jgi:zinc and cadmium transporter
MIAHCILGVVVNFSLLFVTGIAILSAAAGVTLTSIHGFSRRMVPFGGGVLVGVAAFWVLPEIAQVLHWSGAIAWAAAGMAILFTVDRFVYPVCPACSHTHQHSECETRLHGFAVPLLIASGVHAMLDGWGAASNEVGSALAMGMAFHKIPEGIALGVIVRASLASRRSAWAWCALAEGMTLVGGWFETILAPRMSVDSIHAILGLAAGSFLFLGAHAVHGELRRNGPGPAFVPALTGVAGSSVLRLFLH